MLGQGLPLLWAARPAGDRAELRAAVDVLTGLLVVVLVVELLVVWLDVAALAIAAPPPATAAVSASVVSMGVIRWLKLIHLL